ncbi:LysR family transcriptional regulator [Branchiibius hedensis]|uniref:DNA-binding transcriptional regulator, LysR family n=1 Tax=Branchiibius hedensis TaxID=672460 RepID=A0A2Y8ZUX6_9MICO|nr:LysR substrate-binding domain-containing protein [Branchiibius hedensis]PWJ24861.1 LysR family transcriptional regulator [Branchiibius hedensis]SSA33677.1 DNA-binding transcriptional regulator, LysR family [Branchiibius hedensis]
MDIAHLRAFIAVAEELHFGRAAERLHVAQPPLSRTIQQLERELGSKLFDRSTRSVRLTAAGQALLAPAHQVMESLRRAEAAVQSAGSGEVGFIRIGFAGISSYQLVAEWARVVRQHRPGIRLELYSQNFALPAMRKLINDEVDVALGRWDIIPGGISSRIASADSLVMALPDTHPMAQASSVSIADLRHESFISLPPYEGAVLPDRLRRLAHDAGFSANVVQVAPDTLSALALVSAEVGCHLTLASVAEHANQTHVEFIPITDETLEVNLQLAWRSDDVNPALAAVLSLATELLSPRSR